MGNGKVWPSQSSMVLGSSASGRHVQNRSARIAATAAFDCSILLLSEDRDGTQRADLAQPGFHVIRAADAREAKRLFGERPDISVVILDLDAAGAEGAGLAETLRAGQPGRDWVEFLVLPASGASGIAQPFAVPAADMLPRPLRRGQLLAAVTESFNAARLKRLNHDERRSLEDAIAQFQTRIGTAAAQMLAHIRHGAGHAAALPAGNESDAAKRLLALVGEDRTRARLQARIFGSLAQNRTSWLLLLVLSEALQAGQEVTIKSAAYHAGLPLSSALRRLNELCAQGLVARRGDPHDARRSFVSLTPQGQSYFVQYEAELSRTTRKTP